MKRIWIFSFIAILFCLSACEKRESIDEILNGLDGAPVDSIKVPVDGGAILIYTLQPAGKDILAIGSGYMTGNNKGGWVKRYGFDWESYENPNVMAGDRRYTQYPADPSNELIYMSYGLVNNPYIDQIFLKDGDSGKWTRATYDKKKHIYYKEGKNDGVKAVGKNGAVIDIQSTGASDMQQLSKLQQQGRTFLSGVKELRGYDYYFLGATEYQMEKEEWDYVGEAPTEYPSRVMKLNYLFPITPKAYGSGKSTVTLIVSTDSNPFGFIENNEMKQRLNPEVR